MGIKTFQFDIAETMYVKPVNPIMPPIIGAGVVIPQKIALG
jgi:hypothetical protein